MDSADEEKPRRRGLGLFGKRDYERDEDDNKRVASLTGSLFGSRDPALKNIDDYRARTDNSFALAAIPVDQIDKRYYRQEVKYRSSHKPGTVVVDPHAKFLYVVQRGNTAMRYGIGVGRQGFEWSGEAHIGFKRVWPKWTPPVEMIERQPELAKYCADCGGMEGGPANPLGARALYLVADGKDTLYRLHGTPKWNSIGTAASSGCIRLMNQDVIDLYNRVPTGAKVVVLS
ncbi:L,D-transpeptidase [Ahrensia sp. R2A130]|uniref:L,D-transpeptidase n=1 Tax=Ahrensia sp. R2A130 TaxID=744979 RepID=UPI0035290245